MTTLIILALIIILIPSVKKERQTQRLAEQKMANLGKQAISIKDFKYNKSELFNRGYGNKGIYIFTNKSKNDYKYVGQSVNILNRISTHLKGKGNPDMYTHMANGDTFTVDLIKLSDTEFKSLNKLEKHFITKYDTYYNGYNKTKGNN